MKNKQELDFKTSDLNSQQESYCYFVFPTKQEIDFILVGCKSRIARNLSIICQMLAPLSYLFSLC